VFGVGYYPAAHFFFHYPFRLFMARKRKQRTAPARTLAKVLFTLLVLAGFGLVWVDAWLVEKLEGNRWSMPAVVYAEPLELYQGQRIPLAAVMEQLRAAGYREELQGGTGSFFRQGERLTIRLRGFYLADGYHKAQKVELVWGDGRIARVVAAGSPFSVRLEPLEVGRIHPQQKEDRLLVTVREVPKALVDALLVTEDREFHAHHGLSFRGMARALFHNVQEGEMAQGGSTITQQLVKNFFLSPEKSVGRKLAELLLAPLVELHLEKEEILEAYLNEVFVVQQGNRAIHGFGLASEYLFGMPLSELDLRRSALLAGMMKAPSYYHPLKHPERARKRRNLVLRLMAEAGKITPEQARAAAAMPLGLHDGKRLQRSYPAYLDLVRRELRRDYSEETLATEGLRIFSHMNPQWQWRAQAKLQQGIAQLEKTHGRKAAGMDGSVVVVESATSHVLAVTGSRVSQGAGFNRALDARRPIGSLVKPAIYLTALQNGYHLMSPLDDSPVRLKTGQGVWQPQNFDRISHGSVPLYRALAHSYNQASVRLGLEVGIGKVNGTLHKLGVEREIPELPAVLLGAVELSPVEVAQLYTTIASQGFHAPLQAIGQVTDRHGNLLKRYPFPLQQRLGAEEMHLLDFALQAVMHEGTGKGAVSSFRAGTVIAGKSGTSNDQRDSWFAGYDANKTVVVWLGRDDNQPLPVTGSSGALPIWSAVLSANITEGGRPRVPEGVRYLWVEGASGDLSAQSCAGAIYVPFRQGTEPKKQSACILAPSSVLDWFKQWFL
jgi:penicillin-binding protein 1B